MKKIALIIGHSKQSPGAKNPTTGTTEFGFNDGLAHKIKRILDDADGIEVTLVYRDTLAGLPRKANMLKPDFIISLHCNAYNGKSSGSEVLYYHKSNTGKAIACTLQKHLVSALGLRDRGVKPVTSEDRGGYLLSQTKAPCLIAEPFFIDNDSDVATARKNQDALVAAYAQAIIDIAEEL